MRTAPPFELDVTTTRAQRVALAALGAFCTATLGAWAWSHVDAAAGPAGQGLLPWLLVSTGGAVLGGWLGWLGVPRSVGMLAWQQGQWTLRRPPLEPLVGAVHARLDVGNWMLLRLDPDDGSAPVWFGVGAGSAGPAWHPLRATLFAPGSTTAAGRGTEGGARS